MSDVHRLIRVLEDRGHIGLHSHDARKMGISGNPSQRAKDAVSDGVVIRKRRENVGRRQGIRFWLDAYAPIKAELVKPNRTSEPASTRGPEPEARLSPGSHASEGAGVESLLDAGATLFDVDQGPVSAITGKPVPLDRRAA